VHFNQRLMVVYILVEKLQYGVVNPNCIADIAVQSFNFLHAECSVFQLMSSTSLVLFLRPEEQQQHRRDATTTGITAVFEC